MDGVIAIRGIFCYIHRMEKNKKDRRMAKTNAKLLNEVGELSRALSEVKRGRCFYMLTSENTRKLGGVHTITGLRKFFCRKADALSYMNSLIADIPPEAVIRPDSVSVRVVTEMLTFTCQIEKINPI